MRRAVREAFFSFSTDLEGAVPFMYLDVKGLVTTAIGVLIDPVSMALSLPWCRADGSPASREEIVAEWARVKARSDLAKRGGMSFRAVTTLRLTEVAVNLVTMRKLALMWGHLLVRFPDAETWPADAQLSLVSHSWAVGPGFREDEWPKFIAALRAGDFVTAANECKLTEEGNRGVIPRNHRNKVLWRNAAFVVRQGLDPATLYWPRSLADEEETWPEIRLHDSEPPTEPTQPSARATRPWGAELGDDIARAALDDVERRHEDE